MAAHQSGEIDVIDGAYGDASGALLCMQPGEESLPHSIPRMQSDGEAPHRTRSGDGPSSHARQSSDALARSLQRLRANRARMNLRERNRAALRLIAMQFVRFACVGLIAFAIDYALMVFITEVFDIDPVIAATVSYILSTIFNYFASMRFVFHHRDELSRRREFFIFFGLAIVGLAINDVLLWIATDMLFIDYRIAKLGVAVIVTMWNFGSRKVLLDSRV